MGWQGEIEDLQNILVANFEGAFSGTWLWDQFNAGGATAMAVQLKADTRYIEPWIEHIATRQYSAGGGPDQHLGTLWFNLHEPLGLGSSAIYGVAETIRTTIRNRSFNGFRFHGPGGGAPEIHRAGPLGSHFVVTLRCPWDRIAAVDALAFAAPSASDSEAATTAMNTQTFTQTAHGLLRLAPVRHASGLWVNARADAQANLAEGFVTRAPTPNHVQVTSRGFIFCEAHGIGAADTEFWTSQATAGLIVTTVPVSGCVQYLGYVIDADTLHIDVRPGYEV